MNRVGVRNINLDDEIWYVASDIAKLLGYKKAGDAVRNLHNNLHKRKIKYNTSGGKQELLFIDKYALHEILSIKRDYSIEYKNKIYKLITGENFADFISNTSKEGEFLSILDEILSTLNLTGIHQYKVLERYRVDYYIPKLKIAVEYDENSHMNYTYENQEGRQNSIEKELNCEFIRVSDKYSNGHNIALVINTILHKLKYSFVDNVKVAN